MGKKGLLRFDDLKWLKSTKKPKNSANSNLPPLRTVDLFAGCGGLSLGVSEYCRRKKRKHVLEFVSEWDAAILEIFKTNFHPKESTSEDIDTIINGSIRYGKLTKVEEQFLDKYPDAMNQDVLLGGPPCQGNSDLNNHTRRKDDKNTLYLRMVRAAFVLQPKAVVIENVPEVIHSKQDVVNTSLEKLDKLGYHAKEFYLAAKEFGVPQSRKRHFLIAIHKEHGHSPDLTALEPLKFGNEEARTVQWAIEDLLDSVNEHPVMDKPTDADETNQMRMNWLIENDEYDLPNHLRPDCHKDGHNYPAVYGRMYWDKPADTITTGFTSNGQGRFTHPLAYPGRPLTPHEAARLQTFPDWFDFPTTKRTLLKTVIGNAVPPILAMHVVHMVLENIESE